MTPTPVLVRLLSLFADITNGDEAEIDPSIPMAEQGLTSVLGVDLVDEINAEYGLTLGAEAIYDHPTLAGLSTAAEELLSADRMTMSPVRDSLSDVVERLAKVHLRQDVGPWDPARTWADLGLNSVDSADLVDALNDELGISLGAEAISDFVTPGQLAGHIESLLSTPAPDDRLVDFTSDSTPAEEATVPVAIVGQSMRFADLDNVDALEAALWGADARNEGSITWRCDQAPSGLIPTLDRFDAPFFGISAREARRMDPQQRLLLEEAYHAIEDYGHDPASLAGDRVGVFVGAKVGGYEDQVVGVDGPSSQALLGNEMSVLSGRLAHWFDTRGPCVTVDDACTSSLAALHMASESIRRGECELAIVAGVFVTSPRFQALAAEAGLLSTSGRCRPFREDADGMVLGDGVGVLVLKPLPSALADGDHIYAIVRASAMSHNGRAPSIMAPVTRSMRDMIVKLYRDSETDVHSVRLLEAQGTGSPVGDSAELSALTAALTELGAAPHSCVLGSTKSVLGHAVAASGMAAVAKVLASFRRGEVPGWVGGEADHRHLSSHDSPFVLGATPTRLASDGELPTRAGVNAYAFNGTNVHVILEQFKPARRSIGRERPQLVPVSGRTDEALRGNLAALAEWLATHDAALGDVAYTLQVGRQHHARRRAFVVDDCRTLRLQIEQALSQEGGMEPFWSSGDRWLDGERQRGSDPGSPDISADELTDLFRGYCGGATVDFERLHVSDHRQRLSLPGYRFDDHRYWIGGPTDMESASSAPHDAGPERSSVAPELSARELDEHERAHSALTAWAMQTLFAVLADAAGDWARGSSHTVDALADSVQVIDRHRQHFEHLVSMFVREGFMRAAGDHLQITASAQPMAALDERRQDIEREFAEAAVYTPLLALCFEHYPDILAGTRTSVEVLFPKVSDTPMSRLYTGNQMADLCNDLVAWQCVQHILDKVPAGRTIKMIEVGAGTGGTTRPVLEALNRWKDRIDYAYTDLSLAFSTWGAKKFQKEFPRVHFARLDISADPGEQGFAYDDADIVIATNVIHATPDIRESTRNLHSLLRPGGVLVLNELTGCPDVYAMAAGLLDGWWLFRDPEVRIPESPLLDATHWSSVLSDGGFGPTTVLGPTVGRYGVSQNVMVAAKPASIRQELRRTPGREDAGHRVDSPEAARSRRDHGQSGSDALRATVLRSVVEAVEADVAGVDADTVFVELGVDSLIAPELVATLNSALGTQLSASVLFEHSTPNQLIEHLRDSGVERDPGSWELREAPTPTMGLVTPARQVHANLEPPAADDDVIAIIGMSGTFPDARDPEAYWDNIVKGRCSVRPVPRERWDVDAVYDPDPDRLDRTYCKVAGLIPDADLFDPLFFRMSGRDAQITDPQQRVFLEHAWKALEDAGYPPVSLGGTKCGVYVGCVANETPLLNELEGASADPGATMGSYSSVLAARISYLLDLHGPSISIDTACSSSLVALHLAVQSLRSGETDMALAGGVFVMPSARFHVAMSNMSLLSSAGACRPFDSRADGFVPGEGAGALVLKTVGAARRSGDRILAVIRGSALNHDGASNGFTAPSARAQTDLAEEVYRQAGIDVTSIGYAEAHGTGTRLGDAVEAESLTAAHRRFTAARTYCALGSVKAGMGHAAAAAGVAGVIKVVQALRHATIPPTWHVNTPSDLMVWDESPFYFPEQATPWKAPEQGPRRATVSAFGLSGTNAHVLLEEAPAPEHADRDGGLEHVVVVSGHTETALRRNEEALLEWVQRGDCDAAPQLEAIARTTQLNRTAHGHRVAVLASSTSELVTRLREHLQHGESEAVFEGQTMAQPSSIASLFSDRAGHDFLADLARRRRLEPLAWAWVDGLDVPWAELHGEPLAPPVSLPPYRFDHINFQRRPSEPAGSVVYSTRHFEVNVPAWRPEPAPSSVEPPRRLLLMGDESDIAAVRRHWPSTPIILVGQASEDELVPVGESWRISPRSAGDFDKLLAAQAGDVPIDVLNLWPLHAGSDTSVDPAIGASLHLVGAAGRTSARVRRVVCVTRRGSVPQPFDDAAAAVGHSAALVAPEMTFTLLRVDGAASVGECVDHAVSEWAASDPEVLRRDGARFVPELAAPAAADEPIVIRRGAVCLVTGGMGALGRIMSRHLASTLAAHLVLVGRSAPTLETSEHLESLKSSGAASAVYLQADVSDVTAMREVVRSVRQQRGGMHAVVHAAGVLDSRPLSAMDERALEGALKAKVEGVQVLDEVTRDEDLDAVILFSSASAVLGDFGLGGYGVANRFLDAFCEYRNHLRAQGARRGATVSIDWPLWEDGAMRAGGQRLHQQASGVVPLGTAEGLAIFDTVLARGISTAVVMPAVHDGAAPAPRADADHLPTVDTTGGAAEPARPETAGSESLREQVLDATARALGIEVERIDLEADLADYGFDSVSLKTHARRLTEELGIPVSPTVFFACGTLGEVLRLLVDQHGDQIEVPPASRAPERDADPADATDSLLGDAPAPVPNGHSDLLRPGDLTDGLANDAAAVNPVMDVRKDASMPIAVVGMAARFPGAGNIEEYWRNLVGGVDSIVEIPRDRWDWRDWYSADGDREGRSVSKWGGFIDGLDEFDSRFFKISPLEAEMMDPQQRLLLQTAWAAIEDAGWKPESITGRRLGVFVGAQFHEYAQLLASAGLSQAQIGTGVEHSMLANRISYLLDAHGPSEVVDTACSGALTAVHRAMRSLRSGETEIALVGGVSLMLTPRYHVLTTQMGVASPSGRCRTFGANADGYVRGEGVGVLTLKPLAQAIRDNDHVWGVLRGSAVGHGGHAHSFSAPNPRAQADLLLAAWDDASVDAADIGYIEAHGTGTELGDPVEVEGLSTAFDESARHSGRAPAIGACGLGSVKTQIGHLEPAAGIAGLVKLILALRHHIMPGTLNALPRNPYLELEGSPFTVVDRSTVWPAPVIDGEPRRGGVSSFGFGGANAHVVVEEHRQEPPAGEPAGGVGEPRVVMLSARTDAQLRRSARHLADFLSRDFDRHLERVRVVLGEWLGVPFSELDGDTTLGDVGLDATSIASVVSRLRSQCGARPHGLVAGLDTTVAELAAGLPATVDLGDVAYTLAVGRTAHPRRYAVVVGSIDELVERLEQFADGREAETLVGGSGDSDEEAAARDWLRGEDVDWSTYMSGRKVSLPTYSFEPSRHWFSGPEPVAGTVPDAPPTHPFAGSVDEREGIWTLTTTLRGGELFLRDHVVHGSRTLPGVAFLELARYAAGLHIGGTISVVKDLIWAKPLVAGPSPVELRSAASAGPGGTVSIEFTSDEGIHARARCLVSESAQTQQPLPIAAIRDRLTPFASGVQCYERLRGSGLEYGSSFQCLDEVWSSADEALARWTRAPQPASEQRGWVLDPATFDGALHTLLALVDQSSGNPSVPFSMGEVRIHAPLPSNGWAHATRRGQGAGHVPRFDLRITDGDGAVCVDVHDLALRQMAPAANGSYGDPEVAIGDPSTTDGVLAFAPCWVPRDLGEAAQKDRPVQVLCVGEASRLRHAPETDVSVRTATVEDVFHACRDLVAQRNPGRLVIVIDRRDPVGEGLAGLARTSRLENPELAVSVVQTDGLPDVERVRQEVSRGDDDVVVLHGADGRFRQSLREIELPAPSGRPFREGAIAVVTGGRGRIGRLLAEHLVGRGVAGVVLIGRHPADAETERWARQLGVPVMLEDANVTDRAATAAALGRARDRFGGLHVLVHAAGVVRDGALARKSDADWVDVVEPKVRGAEVLDELTARDDLDLFVLCSSCSGVLGNAGQADYSYANCRLDAFARQREELVELHRRSGHTVSIAWPLWRDGGMTVPGHVVDRLRQTLGMAPMPTAVGLEVFDAATLSNQTRVGVAFGDVSTLREKLLAEDQPRDLPDASPAADEDALMRVVANLLRVDVSELDVDEDITNYGVDSIMMISLMKAIERELGVIVEPGVLAEQATIRDMAGALSGMAPEVSVPETERSLSDPSSSSEAGSLSSAPSRSSEPRPAGVGGHDGRLAVIGMAGRFPGAATLDDYWRNLVDGRDVVTEIPSDRWPLDGFFSADKTAAQRSYSRWGGFLDDIYGFDAARYRITEADALAMDPTHRMLMELADELWADAGYDAAELAGSRTGVFIGGGESNYVNRAADRLLPDFERKMVVNTIPNMMAARLCDAFDMHGPAQVIDTACSSSLVAVHNACRAVLAGDCEQAIVGGIELLVDGYLHVALSKAEVLAD